MKRLILFLAFGLPLTALSPQLHAARATPVLNGELQGTVAATGVISPAQLTASVDDYAPTGLAAAAVVRLTSDASRTITGLTGGAAGRIVWLHNAGSNDIVLADDSASSSAANRFALTSALTLAPDAYVQLQYDATSQRWRAITGGGAGSVAASAIANTPAGTIAATNVQAALNELDTEKAAATHASTHASGGSDALKLDDLAAPDDNTDLNATTSKHGLVPKLSGNTTDFLRGDGTFATPPGGGDMAASTYDSNTDGIFEIAQGGTGASTAGGARSALGLGTSAVLNVPASGNAASGEVVKGSDTRLTDARTPSAHAASHASGGSDAVKLDDLAAPDDNTDLNASASKHGLMPKLDGNAAHYFHGDGTQAGIAGEHIDSGTVADARIASTLARDSEVAAGYQPLDPDLTAIAALTSAADKFPYSTGAGAWALADLSTFARSLLDDADEATARGTINAAGTGANNAFTGANRFDLWPRVPFEALPNTDTALTWKHNYRVALDGTALTWTFAGTPDDADTISVLMVASDATDIVFPSSKRVSGADSAITSLTVPGGINFFVFKREATNAVTYLTDTLSTGSGLADLVDDLSPQLGGDLDLNGHAITGLVIGTNVQAYDADLTTYAGITPSANVQSILGAADYAAVRTLLALVIGTNVQAYDADLTTWAGITPAANVGTFLGTPSGANLASALTSALPVSKGGTGATALTDLITLGTHTTGNYAAGDAEAGGATKLRSNAGTQTLSAAGDISVDTTDKQVGVHNGAKEVAIPLIQHRAITFDPKAVCDGTIDRLFLMKCGASETKGITVVAWSISFEADPTTELDLDLKRADAYIGVANAAVMDVCDTTTGTSGESTYTNINSGAVVANQKVLYLEFGTPYTETGHQVIFEWWYEIEED